MQSLDYKIRVQRVDRSIPKNEKQFNADTILKKIQNKTHMSTTHLKVNKVQQPTRDYRSLSQSSTYATTREVKCCGENTQWSVLLHFFAHFCLIKKSHFDITLLQIQATH